MKTEITTVVVTERQLGEQEPWLSLTELCERCRLNPQVVVELVDLGVVSPEPAPSAERSRWRFYSSGLARVRYASRLQRELDMDWQGVAVVMDLMDEIRQLRRQVDSLQRQLG